MYSKQNEDEDEDEEKSADDLEKEPSNDEKVDCESEVEGQVNPNNEDVEADKCLEELETVDDECTAPQDDDMLHGPPTDDG